MKRSQLLRKPKENNEEVETTPEMTSWAFVQEKLSSEDIPYILEVEEPIVSFRDQGSLYCE